MKTRMTRAAEFTVTAADLVEGLLLGTRSGGTAQIANLIRHADGSVDFDLIDHDRRSVIALTLPATGTVTSYAPTFRPAHQALSPATKWLTSRLRSRHASATDPALE